MTNYVRSVNLRPMGRNVVIGLIVLAGLGALIYWAVRSNKEEELTPVPTPSVEERLEDSFKYQIPENFERAELRDVSGADGSGIATRNYEGGKFIHAVLADLPDPEAGTFYEGWLVRGKEADENFAYISTGRMTIAKGGYMLEFESSKDYSEYSGVVITLEKVNDQKPEKHILEGSF
nr:hypothetical protein [uncultured bacterium]